MGVVQVESDVAAAAILPHDNMWDPEHENGKWDVFSYARRLIGRWPVVNIVDQTTNQTMYGYTRGNPLRSR
jgi:hypothetical protein